jgi:hypothetical protein
MFGEFQSPFDACHICRHSTNGLHFNGPESSSSATAQTTENYQSTLGDVGAGATAVNVGAGATAIGAGSVTAGAGATVNVTNADAAVAAASVNAQQNTALGAELVAYNAVNTENSTAADALGFGAEALGTAADFATHVSDNQTITTADALQFGVDALNANAVIANTSQIIASAGEQTALANDAALQMEYAQIVANAAPQTSAAQGEILSGTTPTRAQTNPTMNWANYAIVGGFALAALAFWNSKGKEA